jgi:Domain of unknown function (DUF4440)
MRRIAGLALVAALTLATAPSASAAPHTRRPSDEIRAQYDTLEIGFATENIPLIMSRRSPDFTALLPDGRRQSTEEMTEALRQFFVLNHPPIRTHNTIRALRMEAPDTAVVTCFQQADRYQDLAGKRRHVKHDVTQQETWVRLPVGWRLAAVDSVRDRHRWVDGKPIDPSKPYDPAAPPFTPKKD